MRKKSFQLFILMICLLLRLIFLSQWR